MCWLISLSGKTSFEETLSISIMSPSVLKDKCLSKIVADGVQKARAVTKFYSSQKMMVLEFQDCP